MNYYELNYLLLHIANSYTPFLFPMTSYLRHIDAKRSYMEDEILLTLKDPSLLVPFVNPLFSFPAPSSDDPNLFFSEFFYKESYTLHHFSTTTIRLRSVSPHQTDDLHYPSFSTSFFFKNFTPYSLQPY